MYTISIRKNTDIVIDCRSDDQSRKMHANDRLHAKEQRNDRSNQKRQSKSRELLLEKNAANGTQYNDKQKCQREKKYEMRPADNDRQQHAQLDFSCVKKSF